MSEIKNGKLNQAKVFLFEYLNAKLDRFGYMVNEQTYKLHEKDIAELEATMRKVDGVIKQLPDPYQREILRLRYECGWSWRRIANKMEDNGIGERMCYTLHGRALQKINEILHDNNSIKYAIIHAGRD